MNRISGWHIAFFVLAALFLCLSSSLLFGSAWELVAYQAIGDQRVYAYRDWQSTSYTVGPGDSFDIWAEGQWLYSPQAGMHGPEGHPVYWAPSFYPLPGVRGGALIGRIGEFGQPFYVGRHHHMTSWEQDYPREGDRQVGRLYLRINDDLLGDNKGHVTVRIAVTAPQAAD